jgi:hypothetical protein
MSDSSISEEWRPVVGYEGIYEISSIGRIRGITRTVEIRHWHGGKESRVVLGKVGNHRLDKDGYLSVLLSNRKRQLKKIHALVAEAFIGPRQDGMTVNHKDGNKANNSPGNLEYLSASDNLRHAWATGLNCGRGETHHNAILTESDVMEIRKERNNQTLDELSDRFRVDRTAISSIQIGKSWAHVHRDLIDSSRSMCGSENCNSRLTEEQVRNILSSVGSSAEIGKEFGVSKTTILSIRKRRTWKHVTIPSI